MSTLYDTIEYSGTERTLAGWGIRRESCELVLGNLKADTFRITIPQAVITGSPVFTFEAGIIVRTNRSSASGADNSFSAGTIEFQGKCTMNPLMAGGKTAAGTYDFEGPWWDLTVSQYLQSYKGQTTNFSPGEVILNTASSPQISTSGIRFISVGDQIQCILQFVLDSYAALGLAAPFQYVGRDLNAGVIDLDVSGTGSGVTSENTDATGAPYDYLVNAGTTIDVDLFKMFLKSEIVRAMSAAECIQKMLDWSPRTNCAFDYTTTPPTIYFRNIDNAADVGLALFDGTNHKAINLKRRDDLVPRSVIVGYRITNTVGGSTGIDYVVDKYGPHGSNSASDPDSGPRVLIQTLDLQGFTETFANGHLDVAALACIGGTQATKRGWWASKTGGELACLEDLRARFQDETGAATTIGDAKIYYAEAGVDSTGTAVAANQEFTAADYAFFVNRIVKGTHHAWMTLAGGAAVKSVKVKIVATMQFAEYDAVGASETDTTGNVIHRHNATDQQHFNCELTNGISGDYSTVASSTQGEGYIIGAGGIAQYLWNMLSVLQYEGEYVKVEATFSGGVSMLNRVNLTGGLFEWTTMRAQIQEIKKTFGDKSTYIRVGVARHLNAQQLSALLNMSRFRRPWYNPSVRSDNTLGTSGEVDMPIAAGQANTVEGLKLPQQQAQTYYSVPPSGSTPGTIAGQLNHAPKIIADLLAATTPTPVAPFVAADLKIMQPREVQFCDEAGDTVNGIVHVTGFYTKP